MRYLVIIFLLTLLQFCSAGQKKEAEKQLNGLGHFEFYQDELTKIRLREIVRTDSIYENETGLKFYKSFDKFDTLLLELKYNSFQSDTRRAYLTRNLYDRKGKIIIYELYNMEGKRLEGIKYNYNDKGLLTSTDKLGNDDK
jgi:hypothetical protein